MTNQALSEQLQFLIMPTNEDEAYLNKYIELCDCVIDQASKLLPQEQFNQFASSLSEFADKSNEALNNIEIMLKSGPPQPSKELVSHLEKLQNTVESCEQKLGIRVEF